MSTFQSKAMFAALAAGLGAVGMGHAELRHGQVEPRYRGSSSDRPSLKVAISPITGARYEYRYSLGPGRPGSKLAKRIERGANGIHRNQR